MNHRQQCDFCGRSFSSLAHLDDGRDICSSCFNNGVKDLNVLKQLAQEAKLFVTKLVGASIDFPIIYILTSGKTVAEEAGIGINFTPLFDQRPVGLCKIINQQVNIFIENHHSPLRTILTLIHEYGHALHITRTGGDMFNEVNEGFARWLEYSWLLQNGYRQFAELLLEGEDEYARGLREIIEIYDRLGKPGVLEFVIGSHYNKGEMS